MKVAAICFVYSALPSLSIVQAKHATAPECEIDFNV